jgi:hyperosmotically inducible protein
MYKNLIIIFSSLFILQACTAAAVVGAGVGGYHVGKDKRKFATIMDDSAITTGINAKLLTAKGVSTFDIDVDTYEGVVTLSGHVPSRKIRRKVVNLSKKTEGVKKVISKLKIKK